MNVKIIKLKCYTWDVFIKAPRVFNPFAAGQKYRPINLLKRRV